MECAVWIFMERAPAKALKTLIVKAYLDNWGQQNKTSIVKITLIKYLIYLQLQIILQNYKY